MGDGHEPNSVGVYIPIIRILYFSGRMTIPHIAYIWLASPPPKKKESG